MIRFLFRLGSYGDFCSSFEAWNTDKIDVTFDTYVSLDFLESTLSMTEMVAEPLLSLLLYYKADICRKICQHANVD